MVYISFDDTLIIYGRDVVCNAYSFLLVSPVFVSIRSCGDATPPHHFVSELDSSSPPTHSEVLLGLAQSVTCNIQDTMHNKKVWHDLEIAHQGVGRDSVQGLSACVNANAD